MPSLTKLIQVGARASALSRVQVAEVLNELRIHHPPIEFETEYLLTTGDRDQKTSLRDLDKTDFFTKEIDRMILEDKCRIGIHSAKDLPSPLTKGLVCICMTRGLTSADSLVLKEGISLDNLPKNAVIATSSFRREDAVRRLRSDFKFVDIRGTIDQRLEKLHGGQVDGVVIAEAAIIRLQLTYLNRIILPGETVPGQGQLAILAKEEDREMAELFSCMDVRQ